ncbi:hypothetical protein FRX31_021774 [Thalictrum thalictroides]|uniref:Pectinesterase inhibitor domain-containing protein n=1 Tax=Thalictrum thalictroides TaxID=46969 RepID=A0A7J6VV21_THATH|nr:hypothetical protein FRX31_021774 [Thalictrum thalictroides]
MKAQILLLLSLATLLFLVPAITAVNPRVYTKNVVTDFIAKVCSTTTKSNVCYTSLIPSAKIIKVNNLKQLAELSLSGSVVAAKKRVSHMTMLWSQIKNTKGADKQVLALQGCVENYRKAIGELEASLAAITQPEKVDNDEEEEGFNLKMEVDYNLDRAINVYLPTCPSGFKDLPNESIKADVFKHTLKLQDIIKNARELASKL